MNQIVVINQPEIQEHEKQGSLLVDQAGQVEVTNHDEREVAGMFLSDVTAKMKLIEREFNGSEETPGPVTLAHKAWKSGVALRDRALASFIQAREIISGKIRKYEYDVEQKRLKEAARLQAESTQKAEEERKKQIEEARRLGDKEAVKSLKEAPLSVQATAPKTPEIGKVAGMRRSAPIWDFEITDMNKIPKKFWVVDESKIRAQVKSLGPQHGIPGITVFDARSRG